MRKGLHLEVYLIVNSELKFVIFVGCLNLRKKFVVTLFLKMLIIQYIYIILKSLRFFEK